MNFSEKMKYCSKIDKHFYIFVVDLFKVLW